jgi:hypothetical protein
MDDSLVKKEVSLLVPVRKPAPTIPVGAIFKTFQIYCMELRLLRAQFPHSMMGQLFMNNQLLCIYIGTNNQKGWTPIAGLPDGTYYLHKPANEHKPASIQVTSAETRRQLRMNLTNLTHNELAGYDKEAPLYVNWTSGQPQMTDLARQNIDKVIAAIDMGEEVHLTICSQYLG